MLPVPERNLAALRVAEEEPMKSRVTNIWRDDSAR